MVTVGFVICLFATVTADCTYDSVVSYRGCANSGHNGEPCWNWLQANKWGDEDFITRNEAAENG